MWNIIGRCVLKAFDGVAPSDSIPMKTLDELVKDNINIQVFNGELFVFSVNSTKVIITDYSPETQIDGYQRDLSEYNNKVFCCFHKTTSKRHISGYTFYF